MPIADEIRVKHYGGVPVAETEQPAAPTGDPVNHSQVAQAAESLFSAFNWGATREGGMHWHAIYQRLLGIASGEPL